MKKEKKTLEQYKELGGMFRVYKTMACKLSVEASAFLGKKEWGKLQKAVGTVSDMCSVIEDKMFKEYPELDGEYTKVFYGATTNEAINDVDADVKARAKSFCERLF